MKLVLTEWDFDGNTNIVLDYILNIKPYDELFKDKEFKKDLIEPENICGSHDYDAFEILKMNKPLEDNAINLILTSLPLVDYSSGTKKHVSGLGWYIGKNCIATNYNNPKNDNSLLVSISAEEIGHALGLKDHDFPGECLMVGYFLATPITINEIKFCDRHLAELIRMYIEKSHLQ